MNGLSIIAEKINDSVSATHALFEAGDIPAIVDLAERQANEGAAYIDVNIGRRDSALMAEIVKAVQARVSVPLSLDSPDVEIVKAGLFAYDEQRAEGRKPIVNSINLERMELFDFLKFKPFRAILMANEAQEGAQTKQCKTAEEVLAAALAMRENALRHGLKNCDMIFDPSLAPIGTDFEGLTRMTLFGIEKIGAEERLKGTHMSVGLSNFTVQLPSTRANGLPVKLPLKNAFLTRAVPLGLDFAIANAREDYHALPDNDDAMQTLSDVLALDGFDILARVQRFYA